MSPARYEIIIEGLLDQHWCDWFEGLDMEHLPDGSTRIAGELADEAALRAVVERIFDLNIPILSIRRISSGD